MKIKISANQAALIKTQQSVAVQLSKEVAAAQVHAETAASAVRNILITIALDNDAPKDFQFQEFQLQEGAENILTLGETQKPAPLRAGPLKAASPKAG